MLSDIELEKIGECLITKQHREIIAFLGIEQVTDISENMEMRQVGISVTFIVKAIKDEQYYKDIDVKKPYSIEYRPLNNKETAIEILFFHPISKEVCQK